MSRAILGNTSAPEKSITADPLYSDFYNATNKYYTPAVALSPTALSSYLTNVASNRDNVYGLSFRTPTLPSGIVTPATYDPNDHSMSNMGNHTGQIAVGSNSPSFSNIGGGSFSSPNASEAYGTQVEAANKSNRQDAIYGMLSPSNPGLSKQTFNSYYSNGSDGQPSIHDRLPSAGGVSFADAYTSGQTPDQFNKANPTLTPQVNSGGGSSQGFSGSSTTTSGSSFAAPTQDFGSAYNGASPAQGKQNMNSSLMNGPAYATGGQIGQAPLGAPPQQAGLQPQGQPQQPINSQMLDANMQDMLSRNPQIAAKVKQVVDQAIQSGKITPQQAHMVVQLAQAALNNPALWPQLRQWAIQQGLAGPNDIPQQYDQGLVVAILAAAKTYDHGNGNEAQVTPTQGGMPQLGQKQAFATGGQIKGSGTGTSDSIPAVNSTNGQHIKVSNNEFIIPAHVVAAKGTEFFENLIAKYNPQEQQ